MQYEQAVRDKAAELMNEGTTPAGSRYDIATALKAARECPETRTWEFIQKFQLEPKSAAKDRDMARPDKTLAIKKRSCSREQVIPRKKPKGGGNQSRLLPWTASPPCSSEQYVLGDAKVGGNQLRPLTWTASPP